MNPSLFTLALIFMRLLDHKSHKHASKKFSTYTYYLRGEGASARIRQAFFMRVANKRSPPLRDGLLSFYESIVISPFNKNGSKNSYCKT